jgi:serine/threonine-protein kinase
MGLIMYEMLTKRRPFDSAATPLATVLLRNREPPHALRSVLPSVDPRWEAVIQRCLEREPERRFQTAGALLAALSGEETTAPPESPPAKGRRLGRLVGKLRRR